MAKISLSTRQSWTVLHCAFRLHFASKGNRFFLAMEPSWPSAAPSVSLTRFKVSCRRTRKADSFCLLLLLGFFLWCVCPQGGPLFQLMRMTPMYKIERRGVDPFHPELLTGLSWEARRRRCHLPRRRFASARAETCSVCD